MPEPTVIFDVAIVAPSIVPPLMSAVSATKLSIFAVPSMYKLFHSKLDAPKSPPASEKGTISPLAVTFPVIFKFALPLMSPWK